MTVPGPDLARTVVVLAKRPVPGRVKTRLQTRFSPTDAAALAGAALVDTLRAVAGCAATERIAALDGSPDGLLPPGFQFVAQADGGLDRRLEAAFADAFRVAGGPVLLIGMDTPQVGAGLLDTDWEGADAVLGPAEDGGFWAVGLRRPVPGAFLGVPMSTTETGRRQLERLTALRLRVRLLPTLRDVDTPADAAAVARLAPDTAFAATHRRLLAARRAPHLLYEAALDGHEVLVELDGIPRRLDPSRWTGEPDVVDRLVLGRCEPPVLDVGCGPGRMVAAVARDGAAALGVDVSAGALRLAAGRGAAVLRRAVQDPLPGEGRWGTVLLMDGNIGIGGRPDALLRRCEALLRPGGLLLVEADPDDHADGRHQLRLADRSGRWAGPVPWATLGSATLLRLAGRAALVPVEEWRADGRVFLALRRSG